MLLSVILIAALLFAVAFAVLMEACRPTISLRLLEEAVTDRRQAAGRAARGRRVSYGLSEEDRDGFCQVWHSVREEFETDPNAAVRRADLLLLDLIEDCTGPSGDGDESSGLFAGPDMEREFWCAHEIALRYKNGLAQAIDLDQAIRLYGVLFERLLENQGNARPVGSEIGSDLGRAG